MGHFPEDKRPRPTSHYDKVHALTQTAANRLDLEDMLLRAFNAQAAQELAVTVGFCCGPDAEAQCQIAIREGVARATAEQPLDLTLYFASRRQLHDLLTARCDPVALFLRGDFRADGGLPLVFPILKAFVASRTGGQAEPASNATTASLDEIVDQPS